MSSRERGDLQEVARSPGGRSCGSGGHSGMHDGRPDPPGHDCCTGSGCQSWRTGVLVCASCVALRAGGMGFTDHSQSRLRFCGSLWNAQVSPVSIALQYWSCWSGSLEGH